MYIFLKDFFFFEPVIDELNVKWYNSFSFQDDRSIFLQKHSIYNISDLLFLGRLKNKEKVREVFCSYA